MAPEAGADEFGRTLAPNPSDQLETNVQVSNVTGALGNAGVEAAATA
ncbi:MAG: hypothetical protein U5K43_10115 [Halofilum sp. (in: g-proteobacteria)]|nr:hypothetical protein [Halofilum sp. (in: g-proteobacteria)]